MCSHYKVIADIQIDYDSKFICVTKLAEKLCVPGYDSFWNWIRILNTCEIGQGTFFGV